MFYRFIAPILVGTLFLFSHLSPNSTHSEPRTEAKLLSVARKNVVQYMHDTTVGVDVGESFGTGSLIITENNQWVITAGHVVERLKYTTSVRDSITHKIKSVTKYSTCKIIRTPTVNGKDAESEQVEAEVIRLSVSDSGEDIALLRIIEPNGFAKMSTVFPTQINYIPNLATPVWHTGCYGSKLTVSVLSDGIVSRIGTIYKEAVYDQTNCSAMPGSSGGPVCRKSDGAYVGMLVRGRSSTVNMIVPYRRMYDWAKRVNVTFIFDGSPEPDLEDIKAGPVEEDHEIYKSSLLGKILRIIVN